MSFRSRDVYPDTVVTISCDLYSVFEIKRMAETAKELLIDPEFQRHAVCKIEQKRELIESVLMNISISVVYVFEDENRQKQVVHGRPRISALIFLTIGLLRIDSRCFHILMARSSKSFLLNADPKR